MIAKVCAREECRKEFRLDPEETTLCYCSKRCALLDGTKRLGLSNAHKGLVGEINGAESKAQRLRESHAQVAPEERARRMAALRKKRQEITGQDDDVMELKWGPRRQITKEVGKRGNARRVLLSCGHEVTVPAAALSARCGKCRTEAAGRKPRGRRKVERKS